MCDVCVRVIHVRVELSLSLPWKYVFVEKFTPFTWLHSYHRHFLSFPYTYVCECSRTTTTDPTVSTDRPPSRSSPGFCLCVWNIDNQMKFSTCCVLSLAIQNSMENNIISSESFNVSFMHACMHASKSKSNPSFSCEFTFNKNFMLWRNKIKSCHQFVSRDKYTSEWVHLKWDKISVIHKESRISHSNKITIIETNSSNFKRFGGEFVSKKNVFVYTRVQSIKMTLPDPRQTEIAEFLHTLHHTYEHAQVK